MNRSARGGFTLIEMLIVITIIGILAALLMPGLSKAREKAKTTYCAANLKNLGIGLVALVTRSEGQFPKLTAAGYSQKTDSHGTHLLPVEAICRFMTGDTTPDESWVGLGKPVDKVAVCPRYPRVLLNQDNSDFNPAAYAWNRHVDGDGSNLSTEYLAERPGGGQAYLCIRTEGNATTLSELCVITDSADTGDQYQHVFAWKNTPESVEDEGSLPNRHNKGANLLFADGHVEYKRNPWLRDRKNARNWISPSSTNSGAWSD